MEETIDISQVDLAAIGKMYEEKGFFSRVAGMTKGLKKSHATREYKEARIELQRMSAPLVALVATALLVVVLCVMTAVGAQTREEVAVTVAHIEDEPPVDPPDPPEDPVDPTIDISEVNIVLNAPDSSMATLDMPTADPGGEPNKVSMVKSPVTANFAVGSVKMHGLGDGDGGGFGTRIGPGGGQNVEGCLIGTIIDFKRNADGTPRAEYDVKRGYWEDVRSLVKARFSPSAMSQFFVPNRRVALSHLWIPPQEAANGPKAFGVEKVMKPSGFAVYYKGYLKSNEDRKFRLWGYFDDMMLVMVDGKVVLEYEWNARADRPCPVAGWTPSDRKAVGKVKCPQAHGVMNPGEWITMKAGETVVVEMVVGERPGGFLGGLVLIEEDGVKYPKNPDGTTVLPIFCMRPLAESTKMDLAKGKYRMGVDSPRFNSRKVTEFAFKGDIEVDTGL